MSFKIGVVEWGFPFSGPYSLKIASELGLDGMELDFGEYEMDLPLHNPRVQDMYLECGEKFGIEFPSMALNALNVHGMSCGLDTADGMIAVEVIRKGLETAKRMNIPVVQLPSFHDNRGDIRTEEDFYNTCEKLRFACDIAEDSNLTLALENVLDAEKTKQMLREVGSDRLKVMFDTQNYYLNHRYSQPDMLRELSDYVAQIHVKDGFNNTISSALLGTGDASFLETAKVIKETKWTEWLLLENFYYQKPLSLLTDDTFELVAKDIETLKRIFNE